ncbi:MAG: hypothetical protein CFE45_17025, partial [Burkholderiales bacterium PBB5]
MDQLSDVDPARSSATAVGSVAPVAARPLRGPLPLARPAYRLAAPSDWSFELINEYHEVIRHTAERYGLDTYPN